MSFDVHAQLKDGPVHSIINEILPAGYELLPGVNQIYEFDFALSELRSLTKEELVKKSAFFKKVDGQETLHYRLCRNSALDLGKGASFRVKSFMQAYQFKTAYSTHGLFPYRGKFHPQMIKAIINLIGIKEDDTILDPMMGSGTLNIEASTMGTKNIGIDISPFCTLMVRAKVNALSLSPDILENCLEFANEIFDYFQHFGPLFSTQYSSIDRIPSEISFLEDKRYLEYIYLCYLDSLGYVTRQKSKDTRKLFAIVLNKYINVLRTFSKVRKELNLKIGTSNIIEGDARDLKTCCEMNNECIDGIITSPPYSFAIDYIKGDKSQLEFMGVDVKNLKEKMIGLRGKEANEKVTKYLTDMEKVLSEMYRVLKRGRYIVIVIGTNTSQLQKIAEYIDGIKLEDELVRIAQTQGLSLSQRISRPIEGIRNLIRNEEILIFRK